ncbi:MAG TPA: [FeFe] hydrogenase H-cluster maturation GTPase HydF, partial [Armatimonadetes bacterium]|nr:[FeFe] hydrogenase H-cluster maturation GTPase HydF [Armatimonadota bacterium]
MAGGKLDFGFTSGATFPKDLSSYRLIIHCGACTLNRREMLFRQQTAREMGIPMTNYGITLAFTHGILDRAL